MVEVFLWLFGPALMVASLVVLVWWLRRSRDREPTYEELAVQLSADWRKVQTELGKALGLPALAERLNAIVRRDTDA